MNRNRVKGLLIAMALAAAGLGIMQRLAATSPETPENTRSSGNGKTIPVMLAPLKTIVFEENLKVQGTLKSKYYAYVSPRIPGILEEISVREGDIVQAGKTPLFRTDSLKLEKAVEVARQELRICTRTREEKEAGLEQVMVDLNQAELDLKRYMELRSQNVVSEQNLDHTRATCEKLRAMQKHAQALVNLEQEEEEKARFELVMAEKDLQDAQAFAPVDGIVTLRSAEPGEMGAPGNPVLRIDNVVDLEAAAHIPGQFYQKIHPGRTLVRIRCGEEVMGDFPISYKSPTVDVTLRTFEIRCDVKGNKDGAVPGALADMELILFSRQGMGVPFEAVLSRQGGKVVFVAEGDIAREKPVKTGLETGGTIEVLEGITDPNTAVVVQGQHLLNDGAPISAAKETR